MKIKFQSSQSANVALIVLETPVIFVLEFLAPVLLCRKLSYLCAYRRAPHKYTQALVMSAPDDKDSDCVDVCCE